MDHAEFPCAVPPWDVMPPEALARLAADFGPRRFEAGWRVHAIGDPVGGLHVVREGRVRIADASGEALSDLGPRDAFGERGPMRDGLAPVEVIAPEDTGTPTLPAARFREVVAADPAVRAFFARPRWAELASTNLAEIRVEAPMSPAPRECRPAPRWPRPPGSCATGGSPRCS